MEGLTPGMVSDVLVVGGGLAGWRAAEAAAAAGASVALVANGVGNSPEIHALNCPVHPDDSVARYVEDTLRSGHGANDPELVRALCEGSVALADEFPFDRTADGGYQLLQPLGSSVPRCVSIGHAIGAYALARIRRALAGRVALRQGRVASLAREGDLLLAGFAAPEGAAAGPLRARAVVLATGGWCGRYAFSTNPSYLRGDGIALAQGLGAAVRDLDRVQYEPTAALAPASLRGVPVITTMLFEGATFRNARGEEFLADLHAGKDEMSRAIQDEIAAGRGVPAGDGVQGVWYDATGVPPAVLTGRYASTYRRYLAAGVDIAREPMLVAPAPHTSLGGVVVDAGCRVLDGRGRPVAGLYAAGEVTGGLHGWNRLGGNAGTEVLVFGRIAGARAAAFARKENEA